MDRLNIAISVFQKVPLIGIATIVLLIIGTSAFLTGKALLGVISFLYLFGIYTRLLCTYSDAIKDIECVSSSAFLLTIIAGPLIGATFAFSAMWISKWVSPWGKAEDLAYVLMDSVCMVIAVLALPWLLKITGFTLFPAMFWFYIIRFAAYYAMIPFVKPALLFYSSFLTLVGFFIAITQAYIVVYFLAPTLLPMFGITAWTFGTLPILNPKA